MSGEIRTYFELEARELVDQLARGVALLGGSEPETAQTRDQTRDQTRALARAAHTLKGAAHVVEELAIARLAHQFEDALASYERAPSATAAALLLQLSDALRAALIDAFAAGSGTSADAAASAGLSGESPAAQPGELPRDAALMGWSATSESTVRVDREATGALLAQLSVASSIVSGMRAKLAQMKIPQGKLQRPASEPQEQLGPAAPGALAPTFAEFEAELDRLDRQVAGLYATASGLNLAPTATLLLEAATIVRSAAAQTGREVLCVTEGGQDRVDVQIVESLRDALLHLLRNAVVHAAESPAERQALGKSAALTIRVSVRRNGSALELICADDGRGIALEPIRAAAVRQGILSSGQAARAHRRDLLGLLLQPGFSTRSRVDEMSGRGVGLDAVHSAARRLGGEVRIESEPGRGSSFTLIAPRTLFSLRVLQVLSAGVQYAIPLEAVEQTFRLEAHHNSAGQGSQTVLWNRRTMPLLALQDVMPSAHPVSRRTQRQGALTCIVVRGGVVRGGVVRGGSELFAIAVDRIEGAADVLMQPLPAIAGVDPAIAGAALGSDGQPFLLLHPAALLNPETQRSSAASTSKVESHAPAGPILVIDDSLTTRMLEQSILESEGYTVDLAVSGEQGLAMARSKRYTLFLVDVEMPGMSGLEFIQSAKADPELASIPAILVTSLDSAAMQKRGAEAGAAGYVVKGEFNQQVYLNRIQNVMRGAR